MDSKATPGLGGVALATTSMSDAVYAAILEAIVEGRLAAGSNVREAALAQELGVSRTPLREAFERLKTEGLIVRLPAGGLQVASLSRKDANDAMVVREQLEGLAAGLAADHFASGQLSHDAASNLRFVVMQQETLAETQDVERLMLLGDDFHRGIWKLTGNLWLIRCLSQLLVSLRRYRYLLWTNDNRRGQNIQDHSAILDAIVQGESASAERLMRSHVSGARSLYLDVISERDAEPRANN